MPCVRVAILLEQWDNFALVGVESYQQDVGRMNDTI